MIVSLRDQIKECVDAALAEVGIHGVLAVLHDCFDRNPARFESYPIIQRELRQFDLHLLETLAPHLDESWNEDYEKFQQERCEKHDVTYLHKRARPEQASNHETSATSARKHHPTQAKATEEREMREAKRLNWCDRMPVERDELERIAYIVGKSSAAQRALDCADNHGCDVRFWRIGKTIVVERVDDAEVNHYDPEFWK